MYAVLAFGLLASCFYQMEYTDAPDNLAYLMLAAALVAATTHITRGSKIA